MSPNWFATIALLIWPIVALALYRTRPVNQATLWTIIGGQLLLPVGFAIKFPGVPQFDKLLIPNVCALIGCAFIARKTIRFSNGFGLVEILLIMALIGPFITAELNSDPIVIGEFVLPAESHYDALSATVVQFVELLPFVIGRQLFRSSTDNSEILRVFALAGLLYSIPILLELRMSPQLHTWIYGYFPAGGEGFGQQVRNGGFRAVVFLGHGLMVALFIALSATASAGLLQTRTRLLRCPPAGVTAYLLIILVLCKGVAATFYGGVAVFLVRFTKPRIQLYAATIIVSIALLYPTLRAIDLFPAKLLVELASSGSQDRADSLRFRFDTEELLLARATQRFAFGWGRWGRARLYNEYSGRDETIVDGRWIITMGQFGFFGFLAEFGLLALPVFRALSAVKFAAPRSDAILLAATALLLSINIADLLPNSGLTPWTWLLAGGLLGRAEALRNSVRRNYGRSLKSGAMEFERLKPPPRRLGKILDDADGRTR
jgi:hypothetical protein